VTNRAVLYLRSSKDRNDVSIDAQRRALHELAVARELVVVDEYADAVESGKDEDRPAFLRLLAALVSPARTWHHILMLDTARLGRNQLNSLQFERDCERRGVRVIFRALPEGGDEATMMFLKSVVRAQDQYHSMVSRAKGLAGMAENVRQGWRAGGRAPRGYQLEHHPTGAVRDGAPVLKSRLVVDELVAPTVRAYLELRAQGVPRGRAIARSGAPWPTSSTHSMDWQALTYAGHTVWNMHADRGHGDGVKRRPRAEWQVRRDTHPALITDDQAERILAQQERALQGRRLRASSLLLTGLLVTPDGRAWHSDGCGFYRLGKGPKLAASRVDAAVLEVLMQDLASDDVAQQLQAEMAAHAAGSAPVDGRQLAGLERRITALDGQIAKTVDLAAQLEDPKPVLRRVADLEHQRTQLADELARLSARRVMVATAPNITLDQVRALLRRMCADIAGAAKEKSACPDKARQALMDVLERIELDPSSPAVRLHFAVQTGDSLASPRPSDQSPVVRWIAEAPFPMRRAA